MKPTKKILTVCALAASTAAVASPAEVRLDVGEKATRCDWELLSYETVDGEKGRFAHVVATAEPGREVEIPLAAKGRYRIWIGAVAKRGGGYAMHVRLGREKYPDRMLIDFKVPNVPPENPMIGELEFVVADLDGDTLVVRNAPGSPGGIAWVRLEPVVEEPATKRRKGAGMIATNDSYWIYPNIHRQSGHEIIKILDFVPKIGHNRVVSFRRRRLCLSDEKTFWTGWKGFGGKIPRPLSRSADADALASRRLSRSSRAKRRITSSQSKGRHLERA